MARAGASVLNTASCEVPLAKSASSTVVLVSRAKLGLGFLILLLKSALWGHGVMAKLSSRVQKALTIKPQKEKV